MLSAILIDFLVLVFNLQKCYYAYEYVQFIYLSKKERLGWYSWETFIFA